MTHEDVWRAIEKFAMEHHMSCSGLAKCSGLDPTTLFAAEPLLLRAPKYAGSVLPERAFAPSVVETSVLPFPSFKV